MAQNVIINGVTYSSVPYVEMPKSGGGTAKFVDNSASTVTADKMLSGASAYGADGAIINGNIATKTNADITVNGKTATIPQGYYAATTKTVVSGTANATTAQVLNGVKFFDNNLTLQTGTLAVPSVSQDSSTKVLTIS